MHLRPTLPILKDFNQGLPLPREFYMNLYDSELNVLGHIKTIEYTQIRLIENRKSGRITSINRVLLGISNHSIKIGVRGIEKSMLRIFRCFSTKMLDLS